MKRTPVILVFACVIISLSMFSCDAMFENNMFSKMTHKDLSASSFQDKSPSELRTMLDSDYNLQQIEADPELKQAVLESLKDSFDAPGTPTADGQLAEILAGDIIVGTDPAASQLAAGALGAIQTAQDLQSIDNPTEDDIRTAFTDVMNDILPLDIQKAIGVDATPPQSFVDMIAAFSAADEAYVALNASLGPDGAYLAAVTDEQKVGIAFNALVAGVIGVVEPVTAVDPGNPTPAEIAQALWSAISDPANAVNFVSIPTTAFDDLMGESGIGNIMKGLPFDLSSMS